MKIFKAVLPGLVILLLGANVSALYAQTIPTSFSWTSTGPIISAKSDATHNIVSVKDPSTVYYNGQWIVYASNANSAGGWGMEYLHFTDWSQAGAATPYFMDDNPNFSGYHTAPQVFYFAPQNKWYLIFQSGQPQYSTNSDPTQPQNWTAPRNFFASQPSNVSAWLDFWVICDSTNAYLFFCGDNGNFYRSSTPLANFPNGFSDPTIVYSEANSANLFEADNVYTVEGTGMYLANIECMGPNGHRFFRALTATSLGGAWTPLGNTLSFNTPFLGLDNVTFQSGVTTWTDDFSSGGALIDGNDQTDPININNLQFLYQGVNPNVHVTSYALLPYQLGLATSNANKPTSPTPTPGCTPTAIIPYLQVNAGTWQQASSVTVSAGATVNLGPQPVTGGTWSWTGPNGFTSTSREIDNIPLGAGNNTFTATYTNACGLKTTQTFTITVQSAPTATFTFTPTLAAPTATFTHTPTPTSTPTPIVSSSWRVNAGGPAYTDTTSNIWASDENFSGGSVASGGAVTGTSDSTLYDTQRYGNSFSYSFFVPAGSYQVTLKFAETYSGDFSAGARVFNVAVNGSTVLSNLDVYAQVGANTADDKLINNVSPSGGIITIQFTGGSSTDTNAMVEAIQVIPQPATPTFTNTPTRTSSATGTPTATSTATRTSTATFTFTPTVTSTATASRTSTAVPPTATNTAIPPTSTFTSVPATATATNSPVPPTVTNTPLPPTVTNTPAPPTVTDTPMPPTPTGTSTPVPPTATDSMTPTASLTVTPTNSPVPPTVTSTSTAVPPSPTVSQTPTHTYTFTGTATFTFTNTPVPPTATFTPTPSGAAALTVELLSSITADSTNSPHPFIEVVNTGSGSLNLNNVEVRYWFNCDCTNQSIQTWVDWAGLMPAGTSVTNDVLHTTVATSQGGQTDYISYKFTGNLVLQPGQAIQIQSRFNKSDWSNMLQDNDWSYAAYTSYTPATKVTAYEGGSLVWGQEPSGSSAALKAASVIAYPNPSTGNGVNLAVNLSGNGTGSSNASAKALGSSDGEGIDPNAEVTLKAYTIDGRLIWSTTVSGASLGSTGNHTVYWNEKNYVGNYLANGLYIVTCTVKSQGQTSTALSKILILK